MEVEIGTKALVTGAGGFIGGHLVRRLLAEGHEVAGLDRKREADWQQAVAGSDVLSFDVAALAERPELVAAADEVYHLAADMGGIGFITHHRVACMRSVRGTIALLDLCRPGQRVFFASSACVYPAYRQDRAALVALREPDAFPADAEPGYGWEKLYGELLCDAYRVERGVQTRVARYHNVYGPQGAWDDGREKAPAAVCRKVATAAIVGADEIEIWGDGQQTRSFTYVSDCVEGTLRVARGEDPGAFNVGSSELVTVDELVDAVEAVAGTRLRRRYVPGAPQGVRGRNSDNTRISSVLGWQPTIALADGIEPTYRWVYDQVKRRLDG